MPLISSGILMYRYRNDVLELFLAHPGGPFFKNKDKGVWTIPKGLTEENEDLKKAALREFEEETGIKLNGEFIPLGVVVQKGGKIVHAWAVQGEIPENFIIKSNYFTITWPPGTTQTKKFPEIDKAEFFPADVAKEKIIPAQIPFIETLEQLLK